jgi:hypothetical protein
MNVDEPKNVYLRRLLTHYERILNSTTDLILFCQFGQFTSLEAADFYLTRRIKELREELKREEGTSKKEV